MMWFPIGSEAGTAKGHIGLLDADNCYVMALTLCTGTCTDVSQ